MYNGTGKWRLLPQRTPGDEVCRAAGITPLQARLLANRGITGVEAIRAFLDPKLVSMADPMAMKDMAETASVVADTICAGQRITVFGDYDADGLTATSLLVHFFTRLKVNVGWHIPNRLTEGYGLNGQVLRRIAGDGTSLLITVDCGTSNASEIEQAGRMGMKVVVTDHHLVPEKSGPACPFVNPNRRDCRFPFKDLAGVGVAFYLLVALRAELRSRGFFGDRAEPDLRDFLDLVALGTIADAVPLTGENRAFVKFGLARMERSGWWGIEALKNLCGFENRAVSSEDVAFKLAPRLNAAGRLGDSTSGINLLLARDPLETMRWARALESANKKRRTEEQRILAGAEKLAAENAPVRRTLFMASKGWHRGVLGIAASRLAGRFNRPTALLAVDGETAYGSARSIPGFDLHGALGRLSHLMEGFGGHAMAAGFSVKSDRLEAMEKSFEKVASETMKEEPLPPETLIDEELTLAQVHEGLIEDLARLAPYGEGNPEPRFLARRLRIVGSRIVGANHLKMELGDGVHVREGIGFGMAGKRTFEGALVDVVFTPEISLWQGISRIQLRIADMRAAEP